MSPRRIIDGTQWEPKAIYHDASKDLPSHLECASCGVLFTGIMAWQRHRMMSDDYHVVCIAEEDFPKRGMSKSKHGMWMPFVRKRDPELAKMRERIQKLMAEYLERVGDTED